MTMRKIGLLAALFLGACGGNTGKDDSDPVTGDDDDDDTAPTETGTTDDVLPTVTLEPVAVGIEIESGISAGNVLTYFNYFGDTSIYSPYLVISVADIEYFGLTEADDYTRQQHVCDFFAEFPHVVEEDVLGYGFDYDAGKGGNGEANPLWFFANGRADIFANAIAVGKDNEVYYSEYGDVVDSPACASLLTQGYPDILDGMHVGLGFGQHTTFMLEEYWGNFEDTGFDPNLQAATQTLYTAINHPSSDPAGFDFVAYDWGAAIFFDAPVETMALYDAYGNPIDADVAVASVDASGYLTYGLPQTDSYVRGFAYWYEDYPNLDLSLLKEGVPAGL